MNQTLPIYLCPGLFVFAALSKVNKSILCVTDNFFLASACVIFLLGKFLGKPNLFSNQPVCRMSVKCCDGNSLRGSSDKIGMIQRRFAWPLRMDDTHTNREVYQV